MALIRKRYLNSLLTKGLQFSPIVGVLGHRQVGKTTLIQNLVNQYFTFDDTILLMSAQQNPKSFVKSLLVENKSTIAIDECQLVPNLFPTLKEHVRLNKKPGQFVLSGSVRFSSKKAIRESLTGRILTLELLPFTIGELHHQIISSNIIDIVNAKNMEALLDRKQIDIKNSLGFRKEIKKYLINGGLPGICFLRESGLRKKQIEEQLILMLDRDLRTIYGSTLPYRQIFDFVRFLAVNEGLKFKHTVAKKVTGISEETQKHLLFALEALFLIRSVRLEGDYSGNVYFFEDQAEFNFLNPEPAMDLMAYEGFLYRHLRTQLFYQFEKSYFFFKFQTRGGSMTPVALDIEGKKLGFAVLNSDEPTRSEVESSHSFLRKYSDAKYIFTSLTRKNAQAIDDRTLIVPIEWFC